MTIMSFLVNSGSVFRLLSRTSVILHKHSLHTSSFKKAVVTNLVLKSWESLGNGKEASIERKKTRLEDNSFNITSDTRKQKQLNSLSVLMEGQSEVKNYTYEENKNREKALRGSWTYASLLALSIFGSKAEGEEEKKESELIIMIKRGILALKNGELNKAEQLLHVALKSAQETSNEQAVTYIFDLLANLAYQRDEYPKAERLFKDVLQRMLSDGMETNDNAVVEISLKLASVYASMSDYEKAVQGFQFCIATQEEKIEKYGEKNLDEDTLLLWAMSMDWYARFLLNIHKYDLAKKHFIKAYEMSMRVNGFGHEQTAVLLNDIGSVCALQKEHAEAVQYFEKAIESARESKSTDIGSFYINLGTVYIQQNLIGEAERCCREGLVLSKKVKNADATEEAEICLAEIKKLKTSA